MTIYNENQQYMKKVMEGRMTSKVISKAIYLSIDFTEVMHVLSSE